MLVPKKVRSFTFFPLAIFIYVDLLLGKLGVCVPSEWCWMRCDANDVLSCILWTDGYWVRSRVRGLSRSMLISMFVVVVTFTV
ncbi:hypothetical protein D3C72_2211130 [compost metagenome]